MISTSEQFQRSIAENASVVLKADLTLAGGKVSRLAGDDFLLGGSSFTQAVSSSSSFDVGSAVIGSCKVSLNNIDGRFDAVDFTGATLRPYVGKVLPDGSTEWVRKQSYVVDQPGSYGSVIALTGLDFMCHLERPYADVSTRYPAPLSAIVRDVCHTCGVTLGTSEIPNGSYVVKRRPDDEGLTCLAVLSYAAQAAGCWCRVDSSDRLVIGWYDTRVWETEARLDGGSFDGQAVPYDDGDKADGGSFDDYSAGASADGGEFSARPYAVMSAFASLTLCTDDVVVTGVRVTASDDLTADEGGTGESGESALSGEEGYVLSIGGNPLIEYGQAARIAAHVASRVVGMRFRPFDASVAGDPSLEAGDPVLVVDAKQNMHRTLITSVTYVAGGYATVACSAETPARNSASTFSASTKAIVDLRNSVKRERTARQQAFEQLQGELESSSGLYRTEAKQDDGSTIYYYHDKPTIAESTIVWKYTANAIGISNDGGKTYAYGLDVSGDAILNRIYAIGLNADYIDTGSLKVTDGSRTIFSVDMDLGEVYVDASKVMMGVDSVQDMIYQGRAMFGTCYAQAYSIDKTVSIPEISSIWNGATVAIRFRNGNTASSPKLNVSGTGAYPIRLRGEPLSGVDAWSPGDIIVFTFTGSGWEVADSAAHTYTSSKIEALADSITLSVTNGSLGKTASIIVSADGREQGRASVDLGDVRQAFANDPTQVTISAGRVTFNAGTFVVNSTYFKVTSAGVITATSGTIGGFTIGSSSIYNSSMTLSDRGMFVSYKSEGIGRIQSNAWADNDSIRGLTFDLENNGDYMAWGWRRNASDSAYTWRLIYCARAVSTYKADTLNVCCQLHVWATSDFHNYIVKNFWFDPNNSGANGGITRRTRSFGVVSAFKHNPDGTVNPSSWYTDMWMSFKAGVLIDYSGA